MNIEELTQYIPHRYPFLLVDRVLEIELGKRIVALKNVTINEPFFTGHVPGRPIMPGVLVVEALCQAGGILANKSFPDDSGKDSMYYLSALENVRFRKPVTPGEQLHLEVKIHATRRNICKFTARATLHDGTLATNADITCHRVTKA